MGDVTYRCEITQRDQHRITVKVNGVEYKFSIESIFSICAATSSTRELK